MSTIQSYFSEGGLPVPHFNRSLEGRRLRRKGLPLHLAGREAGASEPTSFQIEACGRPFELKVAQSRDEFEQAFRLLARRYQERGYEEPSENPYRFTPFHALPDTMTFVAKRGETVVATLSLVPDNRLMGLPMECIYGDEIEAMRRDGRKLAEVTSLAEDGLTPREFILVFNSLIRLMMQSHVHSGGDTFVIAVNPKHSNYYAKVVGFESFGGRRLYPSVQNAPAEALWANQDLIARNAPAMYMKAFGEPLPESILTAGARPGSHLRYFGSRSTMADGTKFWEIAEAIRRGEGTATWRSVPQRTWARFTQRLLERRGA